MTSVIVRSAVAPLFAQPSLRAEQVSQLVLGETAAVDEAAGEWRRLRCEHDGYRGWAHAGYVLELADAQAERWRRAADGWSLGVTLALDGGALRIPLRGRLSLVGGAVCVPDGRRAEVVQGEVMASAEVRSAARATPVQNWALAHFAGAAYEWGGVTPWGVDCSGLVQTAFLARGVALPRDAALQVEHGAVVEPGTHRPGDLLFFRGESGDRITHVAFAAGGDGLIHSTVSCGGVVAEPWSVGSRAWALRERLVAVRRLEDQ